MNNGTITGTLSSLESLQNNINKDKIIGILSPLTSLHGSLAISSGKQSQNNQYQSNYNELENKPQINGVVLQGDKTGYQLKLQDHMSTLTVAEIEKILYVGG